MRSSPRPCSTPAPSALPTPAPFRHQTPATRHAQPPETLRPQTSAQSVVRARPAAESLPRPGGFPPSGARRLARSVFVPAALLGLLIAGCGGSDADGTPVAAATPAPAATTAPGAPAASAAPAGSGTPTAPAASGTPTAPAASASPAAPGTPTASGTPTSPAPVTPPPAAGTTTPGTPATTTPGGATADGGAAALAATLPLTGDVDSPDTWTGVRLRALPMVTQSGTFASGSGTQSQTWNGASVWTLLTQAGVSADPAVKNDLLRHVLVATGADGYRAVFSLAELSPAVGNVPALIAYSSTAAGVTTDLGSDGPFRITAPGDARGGRYVSNLSALTVERARTPAAVGGTNAAGSTNGAGASNAGNGGSGSTGGITTSLHVGGEVVHEGDFDAAALRALVPVTVEAGGHRYTGVSLWSLLNGTTGLATDAAVKNAELGLYVVATGSDGYQAVLSVGEIETTFGNRPAVVAYDVDGVPLDGDGFARLVLPTDLKAGRWVANLTAIDVVKAAAP